VHATFPARGASDGRVLVDDGQFVPVGGDGHVLDGDHADDGEEGDARLPALRAAADVVVEDVAAKRHFDLVRGAVAVKFPAGEVRGAFRDTVVDEGVE